jgi:1-acyl-sn-glycerol-3-phosphate acyltransferase
MSERMLLVRRGGGYRAIRLLARVLMGLLHRRRARALEHVPATGGVLLVANHQSMLDIPFIATSIGRRITFVARDSLRTNPVLAFVIHACDGLTVRRGEADRAALEAMVERLRAGECVAIFPEGTRSKDGTVAPFQRGALMVAKRAKVPVVPLGLAGTGAAWPAGRALPRAGRLALVAGEALDPTAPEAAELAHARVAALAAQAEALRSG